MPPTSPPTKPPISGAGPIWISPPPTGQVTSSSPEPGSNSLWPSHSPEPTSLVKSALTESRTTASPVSASTMSHNIGWKGWTHTIRSWSVSTMIVWVSPSSWIVASTSTNARTDCTISSTPTATPASIISPATANHQALGRRLLGTGFWYAG